MDSHNISRGLLVTTAILVALLGASCLDHQQATGSRRVKALKLPAFFDFNWYIKEFGKHYSSATEMLVRQKVYLANLASIFVSQVAYRRRHCSYFLRVNQMSDRTGPEIRSMYGAVADIDFLGFKINPKEIMTSDNYSEKGFIEQPEVAQDPLKLRDLQLQEVIEHQHDSEALEAIVEELEGAPEVPDAHFRRRRNIDGAFASVDKPKTTENNWLDAIGNFWGVLVDGWQTIGRPQRSGFSHGPETVYSDLRKTGGECFTPIKEQGGCGSCYIFSVLALFEYEHCRETGELLNLSEQYVLDCAPLRVNVNGCIGGSQSRTMEYARRYGLELTAEYGPYSGRQLTCPYPIGTIPKQMGRLRIDVNSNLVLVLPHQVDDFIRRIPLLVAVKTTSDFHQYGGGVHNPSARDCRLDAVHGMLMVGSGHQDGLEYFLMRNSHSKHFGEDGYYKLNRKLAPKCILYYATSNGLKRSMPKLISQRNNPDREKVNFIQQNLRMVPLTGSGLW